MIAAYLLHWGLVLLLFLMTEAVLVVLTKTLNWFGLVLFGRFQLVEGEFMPLRPLPGELADAAIPIILGLYLGWWILRRRQKASQQIGASKSPRRGEG